MARSLHAQLVKAQPGVRSGDAALIEVLKEISELMVYGDKHSDKFFE